MPLRSLLVSSAHRSFSRVMHPQSFMYILDDKLIRVMPFQSWLNLPITEALAEWSSYAAGLYLPITEALAE